MNIKRVLIYRLGSLGDTLIALPAFHLIARSFPSSERRVLTNLPSTDKATHISIILEKTDLVHGYMSYPLGLRNPRELSNLHSKIRRWKPDVLIYLAASRGRSKAFRDAFFFKFCGVKKLIGVPYTKEMQENKWMADKLCYEHESERIGRCLSSIGDVQIDKSESWDLGLTVYEQERAMCKLRSFGPNFRFIACSVGTKVDVKNWGQINWQSLVKQLSQKYKNYGLILIGSKEEFKYSEQVSEHWSGAKLNLCGMLKPRESAAVLRMATIFVGHDSGPMHLSASVGTPCVGIFSARNKPGVWFPYGSKHRVIYHKTNCYGCGLEICNRERKKCIRSIAPTEVADAINEILSKRE